MLYYATVLDSQSRSIADRAFVNAASEAVDRSCVQIKNLECELHSALTDCKTLTVGISSLEASCVHQKDVILVDDMIDTAGTLVKAAEILQKHGALRVFAVATHAVFSGPAIQRLTESAALHQVIVTNTIPLTEAGQQCSKIKVLSAASVFGESIRRIHDLTSVSSLFD